MTQKNLRATMDEDDFHRFKGVMSRLKADTNDEAIVALMDEFQSAPEVPECIKVLEDNGYEVVDPEAEEDTDE